MTENDDSGNVLGVKWLSSTSNELNQNGVSDVKVSQYDSQTQANKKMSVDTDRTRVVELLRSRIDSAAHGDIQETSSVLNILSSGTDWIAIESLLQLDYFADLKPSEEDLRAALDESNAWVFSPDEKKVRRAFPFEINQGDRSFLKASLFADGYLLNSTINDCWAPFLNVIPETDIVLIKMRLDENRSFIGSCFVQLNSPQVLQKVLEKKESLFQMTDKGAVPLEKVISMEEFTFNINSTLLSSSDSKKANHSGNLISTDEKLSETSVLELSKTEALISARTNGNTNKNPTAGSEGLSVNLDGLRKQLEFYFSVANLRRDSFMLSHMSKDEQWFPVKLLLSFRRVSDLTSTIEDLKTAIGESKLLELSSDGDKVRRISAFLRNEEDDDKVIESSIFADGFPKASTVEQCRAYFLPVVSDSDIVFLKMRRNRGSFLGSCFIEFSSPEIAKKVLDETEHFSSTPLFEVIKMQSFVDRRLAAMDKKAEGSKVFDGEKQPNKKLNIDSSKTDGILFKEDPMNPVYDKGCIIDIYGLSEDVELTHKNIIQFFKHDREERSGVAFVNFIKEELNLVRVRFHNSNHAISALKKLENITADDLKNDLNGSAQPTSYKILEGEEEKAVWMAIKDMWRKKGGKDFKRPRDRSTGGEIHGHQGKFRRHGRGGGRGGKSGGKSGGKGD